MTKSVFYIKNNGATIKYGILDYSDVLRFAVPFDEMKNLGVDISDKTDEDVIAEATAALQKAESRSFACVQQSYANQLVEMTKGLGVKPLRFSFYVRPDTRGIRAALGAFSHYPLDDNYPKALQVSSDWFWAGFKEPISEQSIRRQVLGVHELSHILHGGYFFEKMGVIGEGFAELVPYYLMDMEKKDSEHHTNLIRLSQKDILPLEFVNKFGCFALGQPPKNQTIQDLRTYQSMYLWMLGYVKRVEKIYRCDKFQAMKQVLKKFAQIEKIPHFDKRMKLLAGFINMPVTDLASRRTLQMAGKSYLTRMIKWYCKTGDLEFPAQTQKGKDGYVRLAKGIQETAHLKGLGNIGPLFQNVVAFYLGAEKKALNTPEQTLVDFVDRFQKRYGLTKYDTVSAICEQFIQIGYWDKEKKTKIKNIAKLLNTDERMVNALWNVSVKKFQERNSIVNKEIVSR